MILLFALLELTLPLLNRRYALYFRRTFDSARLNLDDLPRFFASKTFDPELGWNENPIARDYSATKRYVAQSYGDSFTRGDGVDSEDTWQAHFERITGDAVLNLGVGGYGLDQAVLKFERNARDYPARIAVLGLYPEMYRRALSYHSLYYFNSDAFAFAFKPLFTKTAERFELIPPPCADAPCLIEVLSNRSHPLWAQLARYDHWYQVNQQKPVPGFPNTIKYARVVDQIRRERRARRGADNYFFVTPGALELTEYLVLRFVNETKVMGMSPVIVMLYSPDDLRLIKTGIRLDGALLEFLSAKGIPYVDTARYILNQYRDDDRFEGLSVSLSDRHLNGRGNLLVAEALARGLKGRALLGR